VVTVVSAVARERATLTNATMAIAITAASASPAVSVIVRWRRSQRRTSSPVVYVRDASSCPAWNRRSSAAMSCAFANRAARSRAIARSMIARRSAGVASGIGSSCAPDTTARRIAPSA
jgi:hypothetical protein